MSPVAFSQEKYPIRFKFFHYSRHMGYPKIAAQMVHTFHTSHFKYESPYRRVAMVNTSLATFKLVLESTGKKPDGRITVLTTKSDITLPVSIYAVPEQIFMPGLNNGAMRLSVFLVPLEEIPEDASTYALPCLMLGNGDLRNPDFLKVLPPLLKQVLQHFHLIIRIRGPLQRHTALHYSATFKELQRNPAMQDKILTLLTRYIH